MARTLGAAWAGASLLEQASLVATQARAQARTDLPVLFDIDKVADGVYAAIARGRTILNSNAVVFENANDLLIVDAHAAPSAVYSLVAQIRREITPKPVRYVVSTHLHGDHTQGLPAYRTAAPGATLISTSSTRDRMAAAGAGRFKGVADGASRTLAGFQDQLAKTNVPAEKAYWQEMISQARSFIEEMKDLPNELPDMTVDDHLTIHDKAHELQIMFRGRGHTAGDLFVYCPEKKVIATGDMVHSFFPSMSDCYPLEWPVTVRAVGGLPFTKILGGHGGWQQTPERLPHWCGYLDELVEVVTRAKKQGMPLERLLETATPETLKSLDQGGYRDFLAAQVKKYDFRVQLNTPAEVVARYVRENLTAVFRKLA